MCAMFFNRRKKLEPDPVELDEVELVYEHPIVSPTWERNEPWGILKLLHASIDAVLWCQQISEKGYEFPITRHMVHREVLVVTDGAVKVQRFPEGHNGTPRSEKLLLAGDALKIPSGNWHRIIPVKVSILHMLWTPKGFEYRANPGDEEIWRPQRIVGRG